MARVVAEGSTRTKVAASAGAPVMAKATAAAQARAGKDNMEKERNGWGWFLLLLAIIIALFVFLCWGCVPVRELIDFSHEVPVACGVILEDGSVQGESRTLVAAMKDTGQALADKSGPPSFEITPANVQKRLQATETAARDWKPWYENIGAPEGILGLLGAILAAYLGRNPLRRLLHFVSHIPKGDGNGEVS